MPNQIPLGKPLQFTDAELDELSQVTEEDIQNAKKLWRKYAPDNLVDLVDAVLIETEEG